MGRLVLRVGDGVGGILLCVERLVRGVGYGVEVGVGRVGRRVEGRVRSLLVSVQGAVGRVGLGVRFSVLRLMAGVKSIVAGQIVVEGGVCGVQVCVELGVIGVGLGVLGCVRAVLISVEGVVGRIQHRMGCGVAALHAAVDTPLVQGIEDGMKHGLLRRVTAVESRVQGVADGMAPAGVVGVQNGMNQRLLCRVAAVKAAMDLVELGVNLGMKAVHAAMDQRFR